MQDLFTFHLCLVFLYVSEITAILKKTNLLLPLLFTSDVIIVRRGLDVAKNICNPRLSP